MLLLAFDTATPAVTVALHDGTCVLAEETAHGHRSHGELLAPVIERVLARAGASGTDLTAVAVGTGPGPYTGLRAGLVTARVLGSALGIPVHGVCSLDIIAREAVGAVAVGAVAGGEFIVATDARRKEIYWARYSPSAARVAGPAVVAPADLAVSCPVAGEGPVLYPELLGDPVPPRYPAAAKLAEIIAERISSGDSILPADPLYLRRPDARVPGKPKRVTPL